MARAIWSGTISFGLVNVPVKAYTATRDHTVHFHQVDAKGTRVRHEKVSEKTGRKVRTKVQVDKSLIAGVRVVLGDQVIDSSARAQLGALEAALKA